MENPTGDAIFFTQHYPTMIMMDVSGRFPFNQEGLVKVSARGNSRAETELQTPQLPSQSEPFARASVSAGALPFATGILGSNFT